MSERLFHIKIVAIFSTILSIKKLWEKALLFLFNLWPDVRRVNTYLYNNKITVKENTENIT